MIPIPAWPPASNPMWVRAAQIVTEMRKKGTQNPFIIATLTNTYAESDMTPKVIGDNDTAFSIVQWHWNPRGQRIFDNTRIDVRSETSISKLVDAMFWELQNVYPNVLKELQTATTGAQATQIFCKFYEIAGAANAIQRRVLESEYMTVWLSQNEDFISQHGG